jgi:hypothetical protein
MEWVEGRITKRSVDAAEAPETRDAITARAYTRTDKVDLSSAHEKILELMYEIEALKRQHSGSYVENLQAELCVSYATNRNRERARRWYATRGDCGTARAVLQATNFGRTLPGLPSGSEQARKL